MPAGSDEVLKALTEADVVLCATSASSPLFDSALLADRSVTIAVGSHSPDAAEVDTGLAARGLVVVEEVSAALRECGEIVQAARSRALAREDIIPLQQFVTGAVRPSSGTQPLFFKGAGMAWEDLVVAEALVEAVSAGPAIPTAGNG